MKKFLSLFLVVVITLTISACGNGGKDSSGIAGNSQEHVIEHTGKKIKGEITAASVFSDGLAFVCLDGNKEKAYCIDKQGNIVFELENKIQSAFGEIFNKFENGYALIDGGICNTKGEITYPKDVGATEFFGIALKGGYIVATKVTADYSTSKQEIGVMNTDFEWVVQPSETIYNEVCEDLWTTSALNTQSFYADGVVYFDGCKKYLNVKTGEVTNKTDIKIPSENWIYYTDYTFRNGNEEVMVDLSHLDNISGTCNNGYKKDKVPVIFNNVQVGKLFWSLVDEKGEILFNPVETTEFFTGLTDFSSVKFDGEHTIFYAKSMKKLSSFDSSGKMLAEMNIEDLSDVYIEDGIILLISGGINSKKCYYYNKDFTPLF